MKLFSVLIFLLDTVLGTPSNGDSIVTTEPPSSMVYKINGKNFVCHTPERSQEIVSILEKYSKTKEAMDVCTRLNMDLTTKTDALQNKVDIMDKMLISKAELLSWKDATIAEYQDSQNRVWVNYTLFAVGGVTFGVGVTLLVVYLAGK